MSLVLPVVASRPSVAGLATFRQPRPGAVPRHGETSLFRSSLATHFGRVGSYDRAVPRSVSPAFVGRAAELESLRAALVTARSGEATTVLLAGEAGVGKTRVIAEFVREARSEGATVLIGGCPAIPEGGLPFAPIIEALRSLSRQLSPAELDDVVGSARPQLARLLPGLATDVLAADVPADLNSVQSYLFE